MMSALALTCIVSAHILTVFVVTSFEQWLARITFERWHEGRKTIDENIVKKFSLKQRMSKWKIDAQIFAFNFKKHADNINNGKKITETILKFIYSNMKCTCVKLRRFAWNQRKKCIHFIFIMHEREKNVLCSSPIFVHVCVFVFLLELFNRFSQQSTLFNHFSWFIDLNSSNIILE